MVERTRDTETTLDPVSTRSAIDASRPNAIETILEEARRRAAYASSQWDQNLRQSKQELSFLYEEQWPSKIAIERAQAGRPLLTLNTLPTFVDQVLGDQRQARPAIHIASSDAADTKFTTAGDAPHEIKQAEVYEGLVREIEYESAADTAYDMAAQHAAEAGFGWLRLVSEWRDNDSFDQDIRIRAIRQRYAVLTDPDAQEFDTSDKNYCFVHDWLPIEEFQKRWPKATIGALGPDEGWWGSKDHIRVSEYYRREPRERTLLLLSTGDTAWQDEIGERMEELTAQGVEIERRRKVTQWKVVWSRITAFSELDGPIELPGQTIPVVPVLGKHYDTDEGPIYRGVTRYAQDAKRAHNFWLTAATERIALAPKAPWLVTPQMIEGHEAMWNQSNTANYPFLFYNPDEDNPQVRPTREAPATMPAAEVSIALQMKDEVKSTVGMYDAALGARSNETSGKAIMARQRESDVANFAFTDNLSRAIRRIGQLCVEWIPEVYDSTRTIRIRGPMDDVDTVEINKIVQAEDGSDVVVNDMSKGRFTVRVKAGPSYTTQREEAVEALIEMVRADPSLMQVMGDQLFEAMDWPGAGEVARRLRLLLPRHLLTEQQQAEQPETPPTPEQEVEKLQAQADTAEANAKMAQAEADKAKAETERMKAELEAAQMQGAPEIAETIKQAVAEGVAEIMARERTNA